MQDIVLVKCGGSSMSDEHVQHQVLGGGSFSDAVIGNGSEVAILL